MSRLKRDVVEDVMAGGERSDDRRACLRYDIISDLQQACLTYFDTYVWKL